MYTSVFSCWWVGRWLSAGIWALWWYRNIESRQHKCSHLPGINISHEVIRSAPSTELRSNTFHHFYRWSGVQMGPPTELLNWHLQHSKHAFHLLKSSHIWSFPKEMMYCTCLLFAYKAGKSDRITNSYMWRWVKMNCPLVIWSLWNAYEYQVRMETCWPGWVLQKRGARWCQRLPPGTWATWRFIAHKWTTSQSLWRGHVMVFHYMHSVYPLCIYSLIHYTCNTILLYYMMRMQLKGIHFVLRCLAYMLCSICNL